MLQEWCSFPADLFSPSLGTTATFRYATLNGVSLALQYTGVNGSINPGAIPGTSVGSLPASGGSNVANAPYSGVEAIWDAYNGTGTSTNIDGTPPGWQGERYWLADLGSSLAQHNAHMTFNFSTGVVAYTFPTGSGDAPDEFHYAAVRVL